MLDDLNSCPEGSDRDRGGAAACRDSIISKSILEAVVLGLSIQAPFWPAYVEAEVMVISISILKISWRC